MSVCFVLKQLCLMIKVYYNDILLSLITYICLCVVMTLMFAKIIDKYVMLLQTSIQSSI